MVHGAKYILGTLREDAILYDVSNLKRVSDIDATRTLRIREIKGTDVRAFFGRR